MSVTAARLMPVLYVRSRSDLTAERVRRPRRHRHQHYTQSDPYAYADSCAEHYTEPDPDPDADSVADRYSESDTDTDTRRQSDSDSRQCGRKLYGTCGHHTGQQHYGDQRKPFGHRSWYDHRPRPHI